MRHNIKKLAFAGIFTALAVICSAFSIPVGAARCFPIQHMVNVLTGVFLGPWYACGSAFVTSLIRVLLGTGSLLAFPGSMIGALLCGFCFRSLGRVWAAALGEVIGTGLLGAVAAYPIATLFMAKEAALFGFVIPFGLSSLGGAAISFALLMVMEKTKALGTLRKTLC